MEKLKPAFIDYNHPPMLLRATEFAALKHHILCMLLLSNLIPVSGGDDCRINIYFPT